MKKDRWIYQNGVYIQQLLFQEFKTPMDTEELIGGFFTYLIDDCVPDSIKNYLAKLQIFESLVDSSRHQKPELNDCCFVYALEQTGCYDNETLNQIRLRIQNRYLTQKCINELCLEFKIHLDLIFIDKNAPEGSKKKSKVRSQKNKERKNYMGVENAAPERTHKMNVFEKHYFLEETTPISTYYIKNWRAIKDDTKFDKEFKTHKKKNKTYSYWTSNCTKIKSSNLVRTLF